jgi:hypothetical protein
MRWDDPSKVVARQATILAPYRLEFGTKLPPDQQYWTLCGEMADGDRIQRDCELDQMVREGLIRPEQFHGVEGDEGIYLANVRALRTPPYHQSHLYNGEFTDVLDQALGNGQLRPGLVYLDTIQEPRYSSRLLAGTMNILNYAEGPTLLVWNFIKERPHYGHHHPWEDVYRSLSRQDLFRSAVRKGGWKQHLETVFHYHGTGKRSSTTMGTIVFVRRTT